MTGASTDAGLRTRDGANSRHMGRRLVSKLLGKNADAGEVSERTVVTSRAAG
jgi:hypothetical protein